MVIKEIDRKNREVVNAFIEAQWFTTEMILLGKIIDMTSVEGFIAYKEEKIIG